MPIRRSQWGDTEPVSASSLGNHHLPLVKTIGALLGVGKIRQPDHSPLVYGSTEIICQVLPHGAYLNYVIAPIRGCVNTAYVERDQGNFRRLGVNNCSARKRHTFSRFRKKNYICSSALCSYLTSTKVRAGGFIWSRLGCTIINSPVGTDRNPGHCHF